MTKHRLKLQEEALLRLVYLIRDKRVLLDEDLAQLYAVETKHLNRAVSRNAERFPDDFMFQLSKEEYANCRGADAGHGGRRYNPYAFTEQGVAMLSSVLNSKQAVAVNIQIMRTFVRLRKTQETDLLLARRVQEIERRLDYGEQSQRKQARSISVILRVIKQMRDASLESENEKEPIGFQID